MFDAIEKQFLQSMILAIYSDKQLPTHVCETYTFDFAYSKDDLNPNVSLTLSEGPKVLLVQGHDRSLQQVIRRTIFITQNLDPLPEQCWLTVKLLYYDDRIPSAYSPAGFRDARHDEHFYFARRDDEMVSPRDMLMLAGHSGSRLCFYCDTCV